MSGFMGTVATAQSGVELTPNESSSTSLAVDKHGGLDWEETLPAATPVGTIIQILTKSSVIVEFNIYVSFNLLSIYTCRQRMSRLSRAQGAQWSGVESSSTFVAADQHEGLNCKETSPTATPVSSVGIIQILTKSSVIIELNVYVSFNLLSI